MGRALRRIFDALYDACGVAAGLCLIAIVALICLQVASREFGFAFRGGPDYAGYAMAATTFLGLAHALNRGAHIRVGILLAALGPARRWWAELWCFAFGAVITTWFAFHACRFTYQSWRFNDVSQGLDATPLWVPQLAMAVGTVVFAISFWDNLACVVWRRTSNVRSEELDTGELDGIEGVPLDGGLGTASAERPR